MNYYLPTSKAGRVGTYSCGASPGKKFCRWLLAVLAILLLLECCFDLTTIKQTALSVVSPNISWIKQELFSSHWENTRSCTTNETRLLKGVPHDVISDGSRSNIVGRNLCPIIPRHLVGYIAIKRNVSSLKAVEGEFPDVRMGGFFQPKECTSRHRVAILIPYRNRADQLKVFIYNLHRVLAHQQIDYGVFVIEQGDNLEFNRAKLLNVGFQESTLLHDYQCFVFHDVDLVPVDDRNVYTCPEHPRHMSVTIDNKSGFSYRQMFGGVSAVNKQHMLRVNGFSNRYWGWGAEDDDMSYRLWNQGFQIHRRPGNVARYASLKHVKATPSARRMGLLATWRQRWKEDGLNSLHYKRLDLLFKRLYTWILVDLREA
ncbi:beta-1,4-N-acetylgalactosaminyltransferase bre-4-like [Haemaphysalis longicornis]